MICHALRTLRDHFSQTFSAPVPATCPCTRLCRPHSTANTSAEDRADCFRVGMDSFVQKPVTARTIRQELAAHSQRRKAALAAAGVASATDEPAGRTPRTSVAGSVANGATGRMRRKSVAGPTWSPMDIAEMEVEVAAGGNDNGGGAAEVRVAAPPVQQIQSQALPQPQPPQMVALSGSALRQAASSGAAASIHGAPAAGGSSVNFLHSAASGVPTGFHGASLSHYEYGSSASAHHGKHQKRASHGVFVAPSANPGSK